MQKEQQVWFSLQHQSNEYIQICRSVTTSSPGHYTHLTCRRLFSYIILIAFSHNQVPCVITSHIKTCNNLPSNTTLGELTFSRYNPHRKRRWSLWTRNPKIKWALTHWTQLGCWAPSPVLQVRLLAYWHTRLPSVLHPGDIRYTRVVRDWKLLELTKCTDLAQTMRGLSNEHCVWATRKSVATSN